MRIDHHSNALHSAIKWCYLWGTAKWERCTPACKSFQSFATKLCKVFGMRARGPRVGRGAEEPVPWDYNKACQSDCNSTAFWHVFHHSLGDLKTSWYHIISFTGWINCACHQDWAPNSEVGDVREWQIHNSHLLLHLDRFAAKRAWAFATWLQPTDSREMSMVLSK